MAAEEGENSKSLPPYPEMILEAIDALDNKNGSNKSAILKHIEAKYHGALPPSLPTLLSAHLARMKESGELIFLKNNYFRAGAPGAPPKRGRGRPPKQRDPDAPPPPPKPASAPSASPRPRGRPPKAKAPPTQDADAPVSKPRGRGRPPKKAKTEAAPAPAPAATGDGSAPVKRGRGRPPKVRPVVTSETAAV